MGIRKLLLILLLLSGCGQEQPTPQLFPVPTSFDYTGPTNTRVAVDADAVLVGWTASQLGTHVEIAFMNVRSCMTLNGWANADTDGTTVRLVQQPLVVNGETVGGYFESSTLHITVQSSLPATWSHEFVHYLLFMQIGPHTHEHPAFTSCVS